MGGLLVSSLLGWFEYCCLCLVYDCDFVWFGFVGLFLAFVIGLGLSFGWVV